MGEGSETGARLAELLAALHGLDPGPLRGVLGPADWDGFLAGQRATVRQRQRDVELRDLRLSNLRECLRVSRRRRSPRWIRWR